MSRIEPADKIEGIVGATRHETIHVARAVSAEERVYILHSRACTLAYSDLRLCPFSVALDAGIDLELWGDWQDRPVEVCVDEEYEDLVPERTHVPGDPS